MKSFLDEITGLTSAIDNKVKLEFQKGQSPGQWSSVRFGSYCYEKSSNQEQGNRRACAMLELFGRAAALCLKHDPKGERFQMRSYYKDAKGDLKPNLHISIVPEANQAASAPAAVDYGARLEKAMNALTARNFDLSTMPTHLKNEVMIAVWMEQQLALLETQDSKKATEVPAIDGDAPDV